MPKEKTAPPRLPPESIKRELSECLSNGDSLHSSLYRLSMRPTDFATNGFESPDPNSVNSLVVSAIFHLHTARSALSRAIKCCEAAETRPRAPKR